MVILHVKLKSAMSDDGAFEVMRDRAPRFREVPGLLQLYFARERETGELCGVHVFESQEALEAYRETELAGAMEAAYEAESVRIETYDLLFPLHADRGVPTRLAI